MNILLKILTAPLIPMMCLFYLGLVIRYGEGAGKYRKPYKIEKFLSGIWGKKY